MGCAAGGNVGCSNASPTVYRLLDGKASSDLDIGQELFCAPFFAFLKSEFF
jgi:hypothetical protein